MDKSKLTELQKEQLQHCEFMAASIPPETLNAEKRTVDCIFYTGIDVSRYDFWKNEKYIRRFDPKGADLSFLNNGAPVLDNHSAWEGSASQKGKVEKAWMDGTGYKASLRFSRRKEIDGLWQDIQDGIVNKFSMGTEILEEKKFTEDPTPGAEPITIRLATKWRPFEISLTPLPADFNTTTLNRAENKTTGATAPKGEEEMKEKEEKVEGVEAPPVEAVSLAAPNAEEARAAGAKAERLRQLEIRKIGNAVKLEAALVQQHLDAGTSVEAFRAAALNHLAERSEAHPEIRSHSAEMTRDEADTRREGIKMALLNRFDSAKYPIKESDPAREYAGIASMGLMRVAEACLVARGESVRNLSPSRIVELAISTSDLPFILAGTADTSLRAGYEQYTSDWRKIAARRLAANFRTQNDLTFDMSSGLDLVSEGGEFHYGKLVENKETWRVLTYGKIIPITRQVIINDDLGALTRIPQQLGFKAAVKQADLVWAILVLNGDLSDLVDLFHATHANYTGSGTAISDASIAVGRTMMREQLALGGDHLNIVPKFIVVPSAKERLARQYTSTQYVSATPANINVFAGTLEVIVEPRLTGNGWYLFADPNVPGAEVLIHGYLNGQEGIYSESRQGFGIDGVEFKARMDFGVGVVDFRGAYFNVGA